MNKIGLYTILTFVSFSIQAQISGWQKRCANAEFLHQSVKQVTEIIIHDIYSPPVAARIYAYTTIAAYEAGHFATNNNFSFVDKLHGLTAIPQPDKSKQYCYQLAAIHALLLVAESMIISEDKIREFENKLLNDFKNTGIPPDIYENSLSFGKTVADKIIVWAANDYYKQTRSLTKYAVGKDSTTWRPTPPAYIKAIEPHWGALRTFIIDSAQQFTPPPSSLFSTNTKSSFYAEAKQVMDIGNHLSEEQISIANFWDCNPFKMNVNGHVMYATKKISPGGHWINISALACKKVNVDFVSAAKAYACLSIILADAFISCWYEKYRSKVIRPETFINQYIDQSWLPLLQTPPFPEYTSGHSVISAACAVLLTKLFGAHFAYEDSTEIEFNIPARHFDSFKQAASEAAISRIYGGIHYMPSIINGVTEGEKLGAFIIKKLQL